MSARVKSGDIQTGFGDLEAKDWKSMRSESWWTMERTEGWIRCARGRDVRAVAMRWMREWMSGDIVGWGRLFGGGWMRGGDLVEAARK